MVAVLDENINENGRTVHESLAGVDEKVLELVRDPETPISEWTEPSLIVLRALEAAQASACNILDGVSADQVAPILSISDWSYRDQLFIDMPYDASVIAALMERAGGVIEAGINHKRLYTPIGACIRFPDNELVRDIARKCGSVAQAELDRRGVKR